VRRLLRGDAGSNRRRPKDKFRLRLSDGGYLAVSLEQVQRTFAKSGLLNDRVHFLKGWFSEALPTALITQLRLGDFVTASIDLYRIYNKYRSLRCPSVVSLPRLKI
jgi:Macrocin-O-methyltransferase (TylF)